MECYEDYEHVNIEEVCRLCLKKQENMKLLSEDGLSDMLLECASVQLTAENGCFSLICNDCSLKLSNCYNFKKQIVRSFKIGTWLMKRSISTGNSFVEGNTNEKKASIERENQKQRLTRKCVLKLKNYSEDCFSDESRVKSVELQSQICDVCERECPSSNALMRHKKVHQNTKNYVCSKCGLAFKQSQTLSDHMKRHYDCKKFACEICGKKFYKQYNVTMHMRMHTGEKPYKCNDCEKAFTRPLLLRNHIKQKHTNDKQFICQVCGKGFIDGWQLKIHVRTHTGEKPHKCPHCEMCFTVSSSLHSHVRYKHTFEKNFICCVCAKAFTAKHTLDDHMRIHTGEKKPPKHECNVCGKKCESTTTLKYHVRAVHTGEKPFPCDLCTKRFVRKQHLTAHIRNHTGEKPYVCTHCGKAFGASSSFSIHKRIHTGERPFVCTICGQTYIQSAGLKQHLRSHEQSLFKSEHN